MKTSQYNAHMYIPGVWFVEQLVSQAGGVERVPVTWEPARVAGSIEGQLSSDVTTVIVVARAIVTEVLLEGVISVVVPATVVVVPAAVVVVPAAVVVVPAAVVVADAEVLVVVVVEVGVVATAVRVCLRSM